MCLSLGGLVVLHLVKFPVLIVCMYVGGRRINYFFFCFRVIKCRSLPIARIIMKLFTLRVKYVLLRTTENPICINELTSAQRSVTVDIGTRNK